MRIITAIFRLTCLFFVSIFWFSIAFTILPFLPHDKTIRLARLWAKSTLSSIGIRVIYFGNPGNYIQPNTIIIANHISWLDIPVIYSMYAASFIARIEIQNWFILGRLMRYVNTIFINRNKKRDLLNVNQLVGDYLLKGGTIGLFPEGKTSDGKQILPFRAPILENAISTPGCKILPLVIEYLDKSGNRTSQVTYAGDNTTLYKTIKNTLLIDKIYIKVHILPIVDANNFENRNGLSDHLFTQINNKYLYNQPS